MELRVVSGPDAGRCYPLGHGRHDIGRAAGCQVRLADPSLSRRHAVLDVTPDGVRLRDLGSTNGTCTILSPGKHRASAGSGSVMAQASSAEWPGPTRPLFRVPATSSRGDDTLIRSPHPAPTAARGHALGPGAAVRVGDSVLQLCAQPTSRLPTAPTGDGFLTLTPAPRASADKTECTVRLPRRVDTGPAPTLSALALVIPLLASAVMAVTLRSAIVLAIGILAPAMTVGHYVSERRRHASAASRQRTEYHVALLHARGELAEALALDLAARHRSVPDLADVVATATQRRQRLWERRRTDPDVLRLRLGLGLVTSTVTLVESDGATRQPLLRDAPVDIDLAGSVTGLTGPDRQDVLAAARCLLAQAVTWHSPRDLEVWLIVADPGRLRPWAWLTNTPHLRRDDGPAARRVIVVPPGREPPPVAVQLLADIRARTARRRQGLPGAAQPPEETQVLIVVDGPVGLLELPWVHEVAIAGRGVRVGTLWLGDANPGLPGQCTTSVTVTGATLVRRGAGNPTLVRSDLLGREQAEQVGRALAPLIDAGAPGGGGGGGGRGGGGRGGGGGLPGMIRLPDILAVDLRAPGVVRDVLDRWSGLTAPRLDVPIGRSAGGIYCLDLGRDGPHALVAGTTGSGKSELLRTLVASLALANPPDRVTFVLVDYKGGAAFAECADLPHVGGLVTDLDEVSGERALASLRAELARRERVLRQAGVPDVTSHETRSGGHDRLPRLVVVIDEFRALAEELPQFVDGLVRIAALGRSLGVHLVLATQRPGGIVTADIRANVNVRIALRVRDRVDSCDVVDADDAALLPVGQPGCAVLRCASEDLVQVQTAWVSGRSRPVSASTIRVQLVDPAGSANPSPPARDGGGHVPDTGSRSEGTQPLHDEPTDLARIVSAATNAARLLGLRPAAAPWPPPLPDILDAVDVHSCLASPARAGLDTTCATAGQVPVEQSVGYAIRDEPDQQRLAPVVWNLRTGGHLGFAGTSHSGRSTAIRTVVAGLAAGSCPARLAVCLLDGGGELSALTGLPHVRAHADLGDPDALRYVVAALSRHVRHRSTRPRTDRPLLLLGVDGWEHVMEALSGYQHGRYADELVTVLRLGPSVGVRAVLSGDRALLLPPVSPLLGERVILRLADPHDQVLAGLPRPWQPTDWPPGRGRCASRGSAVQVAVLGGRPDARAQARASQELAGRLRDGHRGCARPDEDAAVAIGRLPTQVGLNDLTTAPDLPRRPVSPAAHQRQTGRLPTPMLIGMGGDRPGPVGLDLSEGGALILGPRGSGRTTAVATIAAVLSRAGVPVTILSASGHAPLNGSSLRVAVLQHADVAGLSARLADQPSLAVLVDDAEMLDPGAEDLLLSHLRRARPTPDRGNLTGSDRNGFASVVAAGRSTELASRYHGLIGELRRAGHALVLHPNQHDAEFLGVALATDMASHPGRGLIVSGRTTQRVQVALPG
ncbi:MAG TPA: FtsK/SpoIIIE domain-containing protein [Dermatophilaceae bacterium]|nr:FtsK/SpoIIIE domain-containing protein [Dermatophilaceae bacterium]